MQTFFHNEQTRVIQFVADMRLYFFEKNNPLFKKTDLTEPVSRSNTSWYDANHNLIQHTWVPGCMDNCLLACLIDVCFNYFSHVMRRVLKKVILNILCMAVLTSLLFDALRCTSEAVIIDTGHYLTSHIRILPKWTVIYEKM